MEKFVVSYTTGKGTGGETTYKTLKEAQQAVRELYWGNSDITNLMLEIYCEDEINNNNYTEWNHERIKRNVSKRIKSLS